MTDECQMKVAEGVMKRDKTLLRELATLPRLEELVQGTEEWLLARVGKCTGSRIGDATAKLKSGGWGASRAGYIAELVTERLTGIPYPRYQSEDMRRGIEKEPQARLDYELLYNVNIKRVGFIPHPSIKMAGSSPDGLIDKDGLVQIKCPKTHNHIRILRGGRIELEYIKQMQFEMACTGRQWCDFVSFDDRMPEPMQLYPVRILRDDKMIGDLEREVKNFLLEVDAEVVALVDQFALEIAA